MDLSTESPAASSLARVPTSIDGDADTMSNRAPGKVRAACNRCHGQKLRCVKKEGQGKCERCRKLNTSCRFSPRAPRSSLKQGNVGMERVRNPFQTPETTDVNADVILGDLESEWISPTMDLPSVSDQNGYFDFCSLGQGGPSGNPDLSWINAPLGSHMSPRDTYEDLNLDLVPLSSGIPGRTSPFPTSSDPRSSEAPGGKQKHPSSPIQDLGNLSAALYECAKNLPSMPEVGVYPPDLSYNSTGDKQSKSKVALFAIDELFRLTSDFMDTLKRLSQPDTQIEDMLFSDSRSPMHETVQPLLTYSPFTQSIPKPDSLPPPGPFSHIDEATVLLIMSCHCRLVDTYMSILRMMQACIKHAVVPHMEEDAVIKLPKLQIGSHETPEVQVNAKSGLAPSDSAMYMFMIIVVTTKLCEQMEEVIAMGGGGCDGDGFADSRSGMWARMKGKTDGLVRDIDGTRRLLQRAPATV